MRMLGANRARPKGGKARFVTSIRIGSTAWLGPLFSGIGSDNDGSRNVIMQGSPLFIRQHGDCFSNKPKEREYRKNPESSILSNFALGYRGRR